VIEGDQPANEAYLLAWLAIIQERVRALTDQRRAGDSNPDDRFRGLYVSDEQVDRLLEWQGRTSSRSFSDSASVTLESEADQLEDEGIELRLRKLGRGFSLSLFDVELLLVAMAPDLDPRFEQLYGYLNDDVTRRRATIGLALELCGASLVDGAARARLSTDGPLIAGRLVQVEETDRPFLSRSLRVPDRVVAYLLGQDQPDPILAPILVPYVEADVGGLDVVGRAVAAGTRLLYVRESTGSAAVSYVATALARVGLPVVVVDLALLDRSEDVDGMAAVAAREAMLRGGALVAAHVDAISELGADRVRRWAEAPGLVAVTGGRDWDPRWARRPPLLLFPPAYADSERRAVWTAQLDGSLQPSWEDLAAYRLTPEQVAMAAEAARQHASARGEDVVTGDLQAGARAQNAAGLQHLARRVVPRADWSDLVLPVAVERQLRSIVGRVRQRQRVLDDWQLASSSSRGRGVTVLFAGDSGTGKTMSAEVVAGNLGLDLYVIDLSTVVDKYIGETEKNLDRIFIEAERVNGVLLFDEADAIFGKRSEVKDARDRYANVEVAYLLQRMEQFDGVAILTTNLRANVDEAFLRRIDVLVEFPVPDRDNRRRIWAKQLKPEVPTTGEIDLDFCARAFEMSGGNIRNVVLAAAFGAAEEARPLAMSDLVRATADEYRKLGRLCVEAEFGSYLPLVSRA
jgi:ATPase family associated with various cellular activities (AAA)